MKNWVWIWGLFAVLLGLFGCEQNSVHQGDSTENPSSLGLERIELTSSGIKGLPGEVYRSQADSPIHWQPWTKESLELAEKAGRLVFTVIVMPQQPSFRTALADLEANQTIVEELNKNYVPILIDGDAAREMGILTVDLCAEVKLGVQLPLMVWMTSEANPVAWIPLPASDSDKVETLFMQSHSMVWKVWKEDPNYVYSNSRIDQENRSERIKKRRDENRELSQEPEVDVVKALRQLTSVYDPVSRSFDQAGGLFPVGSLELLSAASDIEDLPELVKQRSESMLENLLLDLLPSSMFDPLDGGAFSSRRGNSWEFAGFSRDSNSQARICRSLMEAYRVTGNENAKERALGVASFIEENYQTSEGLFALGSEYAGSTESWLWKMDDFRQFLTPEELEVWVLASGIEEMGNIPSELDPLKKYLRANTLRNLKSPLEISEILNKDLDLVQSLLVSSRKKLLDARRERMNYKRELAEANAVTSFQMARTYVSAFRATGDEKFQKLAVETIEKAKEAFSDGPRLTIYPKDGTNSLVPANAFVYCLAIHASLDVASVSEDDAWLFWVDDLATTTVELFEQDGFLLECMPQANLTGLPIADTVMVFGDSTLGLIAQAQARMEILERPIAGLFKNLKTGLPTKAINTPVVFTDLIEACLIREFGETGD